MAASANEPQPYTIYDHPKARRSIETSRSWAALITFGLVALVSSQMVGLPLFDSLARGLIAGFLMYLIAWAAAVTIWKEIVKSELQQAKDRVQARRLEVLAEIEEARRLASERANEALNGGATH
ncbi:MAG: hypothetical protein JHC95_12495 [Solirubrobacteraceae bacterium]|nr:hypothetical protein [Solirubrobacteraceae bacterium]